MTVSIDKNSGFCFGVTSAIRKAEEELTRGQLYCLGDIVHNGQEVDRLEKMGLQTIDYDDLRVLHGGRVLLRAHGEPPSTYRIARDNGIEIIDASCPVVLHLQKRIRDTYAAHPEAQIVIFGKVGHAEVIGLMGQTNNNAVVVESKDDLDKVDYDKPIYLFSQTTKSVEEFRELTQLMRERAKAGFEAHDTICRNVANRVARLREFAAAQDVVIFVGGKKSSNAKVLFEQCREANGHTLFVSSAEELSDERVAEIRRYERVGICGATSTPLWLMESVEERIKEGTMDRNLEV